MSRPGLADRVDSAVFEWDDAVEAGLDCDSARNDAIRRFRDLLIECLELLYYPDADLSPAPDE